MATVTIRGIPDKVMESLDSNAAVYGMSREAYMRMILASAAGDDPTQKKLDNITDMVRSLYYDKQLTNIAEPAPTG